MAPVASTSTLPSTDDFDIDRILNQEASLLSREQEVLRVLAAFKLNPYEILELDWMPSAKITDTDIHRAYRKKSLLIHPDKLKHPRGIEAFDLLKKAEVEMLEVTKRKNIDETIMDARMLVLRELGLDRELPDDHVKLVNLGKGSHEEMAKGNLRERVKRKTKEILIDDELRRRRITKMTMIAEGAEATRVEEAVEKKRKKMLDDKRWEETREDRVTDWRQFQKGPKKKKKNNVLG